MSTARVSGRDYKRPRRHGLALESRQTRGFAIGLAIGLLVAAVIYIADHRPPADGAAAGAWDAPRASRAGTGGAAADQASGPRRGVADATATATDAPGTAKYDFYQMLPKFEVVVPEKERGTRLAPATQVDRPGVYFLQVGSYRDPEVAERIRAQLAKLGIDATVQRVQVDADVWHRVRIGPIKDLPKLNRLRNQLQQSNLDALVIRVDD